MPFIPQEESRQTLMASNVTRGHPWHRIGVQVDEGLNIDSALSVTGSDDRVEVVNLHTRDQDAPKFQGPDGRLAVYLDDLETIKFARSAKSNIFGTIGINGPSYSVKQRREMLEFAYLITGLAHGDAVIDTIGNPNGGRQFFAYIRVPDLVIDENGIADTIERGLYVATSFDGSLPNLVGYSSIRAACTNQLSMIFRGLTQTIRVRHTRNADQRMMEAARALDYIGAVEQQTVDNAKRMLQTDGDKVLERMLDHFWPLADNLTDLARTRRTRERADVRMLYEGPDNLNVDLVGRTGYAAYNAFVEYIDHASGIKVRSGGDPRLPTTTRARNVRRDSPETVIPRASVARAQRAVMPSKFVDMKIKASSFAMAA